MGLYDLGIILFPLSPYYKTTIPLPGQGKMLCEDGNTHTLIFCYVVLKKRFCQDLDRICK